ncbi:hypothetical protein [Carboxylicivirga sp. N1Y90]|uniref:hypothetical protein n=1 Tax=Carboxylicivirga fragile TaxID=3417571 RepID=UPI003D352994|nr:hypothetical protein [Marinilabiliaceae bacterium N1Y90]
MRNWLLILLLASSICLSTYVCSQNATDKYKQLHIQPPLMADAASALYKVNIEVFGNFFSGLLLIKAEKEGKGHHIVLLSEVGLTICEYFTNGELMELKNASSLFQSKSAQKLLAQDFSLLLHTLPLLKQKKANVYKSRSGYKYTTYDDKKISNIKKCRLINGIRVNFNNYQNGIPKQIEFKHSGIRFKMNLKLLK